MTNTDALEHWSGAAGEHWAAEAERYDRMNRLFADQILPAAAPQPGERFLDVGCGNGALTLAIAPALAPDGTAEGLDLSRQMLEVARRRALDQGLGNVAFRHGDAQVVDLPRHGFDAIVSRFGVLFFADAHAAFANLARGLRPGGRIVFACWQAMESNDWVMVPAAAALEHVPVPTGLGTTAAHGAFSLADPDAGVRQGGLTSRVTMSHHPSWTTLPSGSATNAVRSAPTPTTMSSAPPAPEPSPRPRT